MRQATMPTITATGPKAEGPAAELAILKLWANPAPTIMPVTKVAESASPSPARNNCLPGHPPARVKARPARTIPPKFHQALVWAMG